MLFPFVVVAFLFAAAKASPNIDISTTSPLRATIDSVTAASSIPVVDLASIVVSNQNITLHAGTRTSLQGRAAQGYFPATLFLCQALECQGVCLGFDISMFPHNICLIASPPFEFMSVFINQPSNVGLPFGVFAGQTCAHLALLPTVNI
jgi:hypothetical protein